MVIDDEPKAFLQGLHVAIFLFFVLTLRRIKYLNSNSRHVSGMVENNLSEVLKIKGNDEIAKLAININKMQDDLKNRRQKEAEEAKDDERKEYAQIVSNKLTVLKGMVDDLFDYPDPPIMQFEKAHYFVNVDPYQMMRVFQNILINAIKYKDKGTKVIVSIVAEEGSCLVGVYNQRRDLGEIDVSNLFNRYYRSDTAKEHNITGSGVGLSIAKTLVELHEGQIWGEKKDGGVWFYVRLFPI